MISRLMAPALRKYAAIDLTKFIISIVSAEHAIKSTILKMKNELFNRENGGGK